GGGGGGGGSGPSAKTEGDEEGDDDTSRNRPPRVGDPVALPNISVAQAVFIPLAALLAGASDPDGQALEVQKLVASAGMLVPAKGGWVYLAPAAATERVTLSYVVSDGVEGVPQHAVFEIDPEGIEASGLDLPSATFAALPAANREEPDEPNADAAGLALAGLASVRTAAGQPGPAGTDTVGAEASAAGTPAADTVSSGTVVAEAAPAAENVSVASGGDMAASAAGDPAVVAAPAAIETAPVEVATTPAVSEQQAMEQAILAQPVTGTASADSGADAAVTQAEGDTFVFAAAATSDPPPQSVSQIVELQVGDQLQVKDELAAESPSAAAGDPDQLFADTYGEGGETRPYAFQAEAAPLTGSASSDLVATPDDTDAAPPVPTADALALA
ncbi:cadherin-like domain-containing protein, partial [Xanthobacter autotrophicus]|uniref:cadherin-like domain-containing protein n=3 Tax=Xanthobacter TaxID=279 RepID=UPI0024AAC78B